MKKDFFNKIYVQMYLYIIIGECYYDNFFCDKKDKSNVVILKHEWL